MTLGPIVPRSQAIVQLNRVQGRRCFNSRAHDFCAQSGASRPADDKTSESLDRFPTQLTHSMLSPSPFNKRTWYEELTSQELTHSSVFRNLHNYRTEGTFHSNAVHRNIRTQALVLWHPRALFLAEISWQARVLAFGQPWRRFKLALTTSCND